MPYKERGPFHVAMRAWLKDLRPPDAVSTIGAIKQTSSHKYEATVLEAGTYLSFPEPKKITLEQMRWLESQFSGGESTVANKASIFRQFLKSSGNRDAMRWKIKARHGSVSMTRVWLNERQVFKVRQEAQKMGLLMELTYSLAVDMGLRAVDCMNLTIRNAEEFLDYGRSMILGKGRNGGKIAEQFFSQATTDPLVRYLDAREKWTLETGMDSDRLLVLKVRGNRIIPIRYEDHIDYPIMDLSDLCGFRFRFHDLRATFGNRLHKRGYPVETIAHLMRHENPGVTFKRYIGMDQDRMRDAMDSLCPATSSQLPRGLDYPIPREFELAEAPGAWVQNPCSSRSRSEL